jgi:hypothetical protein
VAGACIDRGPVGFGRDQLLALFAQLLKSAADGTRVTLQVSPRTFSATVDDIEFSAQP